jgi:hypothetical protein
MSQQNSSHTFINMFTTNQMILERLPEWFVCPGSFAKAAMICNEPTCSAYPATCFDEECACQGPHRKHLQLRIRGFLEKLNEPPIVPEELRQAEKAMNGLIDSLTNIVDQCRDGHRTLINEYMATHYQFAGLRQMLINRGQPDAKDMTGGNMARMSQKWNNSSR